MENTLKGIFLKKSKMRIISISFLDSHINCNNYIYYDDHVTYCHSLLESADIYILLLKIQRVYLYRVFFFYF
mgnify:CR=1 FL=1